jgi:hypothetical protein
MSASISSVTPSKPIRLSKEELQYRHQVLTELLKKNTPVCQAMREAGYTEQRAQRGWRAVPVEVTQMLLDSGARHIRMGKALAENKEKKELEHAIVGAMYERMVEGHKDGVPAAKILTTHKSVASSFIQEQQNNVVVIQAPSDWKPSIIEAGAPQPEELKQLPELPEYE